MICSLFAGFASAQNASASKKIYKADSTSLASHPLPAWYQDAKLGIFIHWGLYSVPAWAKGTKRPLADIMKEGSGEKWFANNPYAEWYYNSLRIKGSSTEKHHAETYGSEFSYFDFAKRFNASIKKWNANKMAGLLKDAGARYVVLTTKHHDGFLLWPGETKNPFITNYQASRDLVGELTTAVRKQNMRMGLYYSSGLDWTFNTKVISNFPDMFQAVPQQQAYADSELLTLPCKLKCYSQIESAAIYTKVQEGDATMLIQGSDAWTKKIKGMDFILR